MAEIATQKLGFDEQKRQYNKYQAVEAALRNQIIKAINSDYLELLQKYTHWYDKQYIYEIFTFLQNTYGQLSLSGLKWKEQEIDGIIYDLNQKIDTAFNCIQLFKICV